MRCLPDRLQRGSGLQEFWDWGHMEVCCSLASVLWNSKDHLYLGQNCIWKIYIFCIIIIIIIDTYTIYLFYLYHWAAAHKPAHAGISACIYVPLHHHFFVGKLDCNICIILYHCNILVFSFNYWLFVLSMKSINTTDAFPAKNSVEPSVFIEQFEMICEEYFHFVHIYTDGLVREEVAAAAAFSQSGGTKAARLRDNSSVYQAELRGLLLGMDIVETPSAIGFIVCSDSLHALKNLKAEETILSWRNFAGGSTAWPRKWLSAGYLDI